MLGIRNLKRQSLPAPTDADQVLARLRAEMGVKRSVAVRVSPACRSAIVLGFVHPIILLPADDSPDPQALEQVIGHELAHIQRRDDWANLLQRTMEALFFFNPAVRWTSRKLALEREIACDDCVLQRGSHPQAYALLLVNLAGRKLPSPLPLASGVSTGKAQLQQRIHMILQTHRNTSAQLAAAKLGLVSTATAVLVVLFLNAAPRIALAEDISVATPVAAETSVATTEPAAESGPADVSHGPRFKARASNDEDVKIAPAAPVPPVRPLRRASRGRLVSPLKSASIASSGWWSPCSRNRNVRGLPL